MISTLGARAAWRPALWVLAAAVAMVGVDLGRRILATNDEARFAMLAQDMLSRGTWLFPQLNGVAYNAKPPLQAWLIALASWPAGHVTQLTAALPSALAAVGTALVVFAVGRTLFGPTAGAFAALATITTQGWFLHARLPMPDMLVTFFITGAVAMLWPMAGGRPGIGRRGLLTNGLRPQGPTPISPEGSMAPAKPALERPGLWWLGFWGAMVAAFWAKGAAALLPLAVAVAWGFAFRRPGWWQSLHLPIGLALFAVLIAPWWIGKLLTQASEMHEIVVGDNLFWYLPRSLAVLAGPPQHLVGILFPWVLVIPLAGWRAVTAMRQRGADRDALGFVVVWALALLACLGISEQQRLRYYLPLVPPVALILGWWAARALGGDHAGPRIPWRVYAVVALVIAGATATAALVRPTWLNATHVAFPTSAIEATVMAAGLAVMLGVLVYGVRRDRLAQVFAVACLGSAAWVVGWYHWELERRNAAYDYPRVRAEVRRLLPEAPVVATWGVYELPLSFYLGRRVVPIRTHGDLARVMSEHPRASAVLTEAALAQVENRGHLRVLPVDRLNFDRIVLVSYPAGAPRAGSRP
jgi:4-amino-4-deoxy-L-arabinose transferase-like glycosyltransferase